MHSLISEYLGDIRAVAGADEAVFWRITPSGDGLQPACWSTDNDLPPAHFERGNWASLVAWAAQERIVHCDINEGRVRLAVAPVVGDLETFGALSLSSTRGLSVDRENAKTMTGRFAAHLASLHEMLEAREGHERAARQTGVLLTVAQKLPTHRTIEALGSAICAAALEMSGARRAALVRWDPGQNAGEIAYATRGHVIPPGLPVNDHFHTGMACASDVPVVVEDAALQHPKIRLYSPAEPERAVGSFAIVPIHGEGNVIGAIAIEGDEPSDVRVGDTKSLRLLAHLAGASLETVWEIAEITRRATTDALTGLPNRRAFDDRLRHLCADADRTGGNFCIVLVDVDHFKQVNDGYGHQAGDAVLRRVAAELGSGVRGMDLCARYGGEELALLMPQTGLPGAQEVAERLRNRVARTVVDFEGNPISVTISAGVAAYPESGTSIDSLLAAADRALYAAKRGGRNRVVSYKLT
jgi:diguanylate cyclase (GGDEF)-like protein